MKKRLITFAMKNFDENELSIKIGYKEGENNGFNSNQQKKEVKQNAVSLMYSRIGIANIVNYPLYSNGR